MIHLKSTLAVSAIMLTGLVAASPFPYASDHEPRKPLRTVSAPVEAAAIPAALTAWADPPAKLQTPAPAEPPVQVAVAAPEARVAEPAVVPVAVAAQAPPRSVSVQAKIEQARRRKLARAARDRQIASKQSAPAAAETQVASRAAPGTSQKIDPIGDILRGLGIGKEG